MSARTMTTLVFLALLAAGRAAAQPDPRLAARLAPGARAPVAAVIDSAHAAGLPTEPLVQKALEGSARGAAPERIVAAVRNMSDRLRAARAALGARSTEAELTAGAAALYAGMGPGELGRLRRARPGESVAVPLVAFADIVERGVPNRTAARVILELSDAHVPAEAYTELRRVVADDIRAGRPPESVAERRLGEILLQHARSPVRPRPM